MRLVIAITGASGSIYGIRLLEELRRQRVETHLLLSPWATATLTAETDYSVQNVEALADFVHDPGNLAAPLASGSFPTDGMAVVPCSMKTLAGIAHGYSDDLITRAADVTIKEKRPLILVTRETPLSAIHLENMLKLARLGAAILPPMPAFYTKPQTIEELVDQTVGRILEQLHLEAPRLKRWGEK